MSLWHINCLKLVKEVLLVKNSTASAGCRFDPWVGKISWRRIWQPTPAFVPGKKSHGERSLEGRLPSMGSQGVGDG